ncbi:ParB/RepB/Spo0J family partition protein [Noviherbaspirillum sp. Root189]|uniref:ParB/RepB/Spo0J family partition protein n=1 Tax=Noviherbaspirillum sp. Root189 TaxID=1736487 RepID=UPI00070C9EDF|nr:ParB/RepB/Spo0J family partition protein [Noviherbaspirillum sp. Root189]KRB72346.1 hypothetical protein ASE07_27190 [Noviherbaspirillum sp. Root189]
MSKIKELAGKTAGIQARSVEKTGHRPPKTAPVMLYDATARMHAAEQKAEELEAKLNAALESTAAFEVPLSDLREIAGRKRQLDDEQFNELKENLRHNELVSPVIVRPSDDGGYEIVSGHNRVRAFRELGRERIPAIVRRTEAVQADINAFYANLLQPSLPDYEKYLGFRLIRLRRPEMSQAQIAEMAGISPTRLSRLLAFDGLPDEAHAVLAQHPGALGADAASTLAAVAKDGGADRVTDAIKKVIEEGIDQASAVALASRRETVAAKTKPSVEVIKFKVGKSPVCSYRKADTMLRVDFRTAEDANAVHEEIQKVLQRYIDRLRERN